MSDVLTLAPFPQLRMRRLRRHAFSRNLMRENQVHVHDLIQPLFVLEGHNNRLDVESMPGVACLSIDLLLKQCEQIAALGIPAVVLFPRLSAQARSQNAQEAYNPNGLIPQAIAQIKQHIPDLGVITDVALDPYTSHGQDGLVNESGYVMNDETITVLVKQALCHAHAGADVLGPSDMMDGRIGIIRAALEENGFIDTQIMSYAAKFASNYYAPFRDAVGSTAFLGAGNKYTYQIDPANGREALREVALDIAEGADMVMVKPGMPYLDIIAKIRQEYGVPTMAYHVSGEYAMLKSAAMQGWLDEKKAVLEAMQCFKRAGCDAVLTYYAQQIATWLNNDSA